MITRIYAQGFKGIDFSMPLTARTVITGRVGSGKSARALALALLVTGNLPGTGVARKAGDMMDAVCSGDSMMVGIELDSGLTLERAFKRGKTGTVKSEYRMDGSTVLKDRFGVVLEREGINVVDIPGFLAMSDAKKVDELFRLFPPKGDVRGLTKKITDAKESLSAIEGDIKALEASASSLAKSIAESALPAGTLPETQAEIVRVQNEHQAARDEMIREQERAAQQKREAEAEEKRKSAEIVDNQTEKQPENNAHQATVTTRTESLGLPIAENQRQNAPTAHVCNCGGKCKTEAVDDGVAALERILSALERAGCEGCAAKMVLKRELKAMKAKGASHE